MVQPGRIDRQREHQANERTFLAWLRTSVALVGFGFAIARFGIFLRQMKVVVEQPPFESIHPLFNSQVLGISLVMLGVVVIGLAGWRYNTTFWQIERGNYRPNRWMVGAMTVVVMLLGLLSIPILLVKSFDQAHPPASGSTRQAP
ncbi:MAG: DUF202 domain-containing protein [Leptolyngbya sp. RL_3_1]|nr:DUF202 domain-containing protein [Leptolyngbya sp. RL_3_1]